MQAIHPDEKEVAQFMALQKRSKDRLHIIQEIRNKGNYIYNKTAYENKSGKIIPCRRPSKKSPSEMYLPCEHCFGFFKKTRLARHSLTCWNNPKRVSHRGHTIGRSLTLLTAGNDSSKELKSILENMKTDKESLTVRQDELIQKYGQWLCEKHSTKKHLKNDISQKMRELARLLIQLNKNQKEGQLMTLRSVLKPAHFFVLIEAVKELTGIDNNGKKKATLALKLGYSIQNCLMILKNEALMESQLEKRKEVDDMIELYKLNWSNFVLRKATEEIDRAKYNKPSLLPIAEDVRKMNKYMHDKEDVLLSLIEHNQASEQDFIEFCQINLCHVIMFNRKRVGEVQRLEKSVFINRICNETPQGEIEAALSDHEKLLVKNFTLLEIRGKKGRKVPLLLTPKMTKNMETILLKRNNCNVPNSNSYVFGKCKSDSFMRGCDCLRTVSRKCGAKKPENLTSTRLRKHIATVSQILHLSENDLELLSRHLGHDLSIHKEYYRLPDRTMELAKVSKLLIQFDKGVITPGQNFDEIDPSISEFEDPSSEEDSDEESSKDKQPKKGLNERESCALKQLLKKDLTQKSSLNERKRKRKSSEEQVGIVMRIFQRKK